MLMLYVFFLLETVRTSSEIMQKDLDDNVYVDYQRRDSHFECIQSAAVKEITKKVTHQDIELKGTGHYWYLLKIICFHKNLLGNKQWRAVDILKHFEMRLL